MPAQGAAPEGGTSGQRLISDGNGRNNEAKESAVQGDVVPDVVAEINTPHRLGREQSAAAAFKYRRPKTTFRNWSWQPGKPEVNKQ